MTLFSDVLSIPSNPEDIFTLLNPIGHGAFGYVYKAIHNQSKEIYAIKIINYFKEDINCIENKRHIDNINFCYQTVQQETALMKKVSESNYIVKYYGSYFSRRTNTLWLILEYCSFGSTVDLMLAMNRIYIEVEVATIIKMVLQGLIIIHEKNLIHRDIKGANILLSEDGFAKLGDFGVGSKLEEDFRTSKKGSPHWMSPQVVKKENYNNKTDIWSLGITCIELLQGLPPNSELSPQEVMEKIGNKKFSINDFFGNKKSNYSKEFINFVSLCLQINPEKRASAKELINHEFIKKYAKDNSFLKTLLKSQEKNMEKYRKEFENTEFKLNLGYNNNDFFKLNDKQMLYQDLNLKESFFNFSKIYIDNNNKIVKKNSLLNRISPINSNRKLIYNKISQIKTKLKNLDKINEKINNSLKINRRNTNNLKCNLNKTITKSNSFIILNEEKIKINKSRNKKNTEGNIFLTKNNSNFYSKNKCEVINFGKSMKKTLSKDLLNKNIYKKKIIINQGKQGKSCDKKYDKINSYKKIKSINSNINTDMNTTNTNSLNNGNYSQIRNNSFILSSTLNSKKKINLKMKIPNRTNGNIEFMPKLNLNKILNNNRNKLNLLKEPEANEDISESSDNDYIINRTNNYTINKGCYYDHENKNVLNLIKNYNNKNNMDTINSCIILDSKDTIMSIHASNNNLNQPHKKYY